MNQHRSSVKYAPGNWAVIRNCCRSGNCFHCRGALTGKGALPVKHADGYSQEYAEHVARNYAAYNGRAVPMEGT